MFLQNKLQKLNLQNLIFVSNLIKNIEHFIFYGTLLGIIREKNIIKGDEIDIGEEVLNSNLFNTLSKLSRLGKLLSTISKNFKFIKDLRIDLTTMDFFLTCTYSKLNKTYYMEVCEIRGYNGGVSIMYKSKSKESVLKKMDQVRKLALTKNIFPGK